MAKHSVLFANDDVLTQWEMAECLSRAGFAVTSACRSQEVLDLLADHDEFDLLLADLDLPGGPGCNAVAHIWRRQHPHRPVVFTGTSRTWLGHPLQSREWFLRSPFTELALLQTVVSALDHARLTPPAIIRPTPFHPVH